MSRSTTACACGQQLQVVVAGRPQAIACTRGEGHGGDHHSRIVWSPRLAPSPTHQDRRPLR
jgi:hypothetical protein